MQQNPDAIDFYARATRDFTGLDSPRVLDFGCGAGGTVKGLIDQGIDAYGADIDGDFTSDIAFARERIGIIEMAPYRLPYPDDHFDAVFSSTVLEHAQNKEECLREIHRVLKPGGVSMHVLPSKWYLPVEPHINVPFAAALWPYAPRWYLAACALVGLRNEFQRDMGWREVARQNHDYIKRGLSYWTHRSLARVSRRVFGNYESPMDYFVKHSTGGLAALSRRFPLFGLSSWAMGTFRMFIMVSRKAV